MKRKLAAALVSLLIMGCATQGPRDDAPTPEETRLAVYQRNAGEARDEVVFPRVDGWSELLREHIAVRTADDNYFLLTLELACSEAFRAGPDIRIAIEQDTPNTLHRFDRIRFGERACRIQAIRPLDARSIHEDMTDAGLQDPFIARGLHGGGS